MLFVFCKIQEIRRVQYRCETFCRAFFRQKFLKRIRYLITECICHLSLQVGLFRFKFYLLSSKILKISGFNGWIPTYLSTWCYKNDCTRRNSVTRNHWLLTRRLLARKNVQVPVQITYRFQSRKGFGLSKA